MNTRNTTIWLLITLSVNGFLGSIASIYAGWGMSGILISIILTVTILIMCFLSLRPVFQKNDRGVTLLEAVDSVGMVDIENREDLKSPLPPHEFYKKALSEIVITGISAYRTFDQHLEILKQCLSSGKKLFLLILHPNSRVIAEISQLEEKDVSSDIREVIKIIKTNNLHRHPGFKVCFRESLPPFTGVMIDGDLVFSGELPQDQNGQIRVQPVSPHRSQHKGIVLQLRKKKSSPLGTFDFFAEDLRKQWTKDSKEDTTLFE